MKKAFVMVLVLWFGRATAASNWFGITGSLGTYGEVYNMAGREARRDPATGRIYFRPVVTVLGMSFPFEVLVSTEETRFRQPFNRFGISPRWKWATVHAGDFTPNLSPYTARGIRLRGGGIELKPGTFQFSFVGGRSQRAVPGRAYERNLWAIQFGVGRRGRTFWDVGLLWASDDTSSVDSAAVPPQQNLVVASRLYLRLLRGKLSLGVEGAGSLHTRDMRSSSADSLVRENIPERYLGLYERVSKLFVPRLSTRADYAYKLKLGLRLRLGEFRAEYLRVGPGFVSLGVPYMGNDRKQVNLGLSLRPMRKLSLRLGYFGYRDNLKGEKTRTTSRRSLSSSLRIRPSSKLGLGLSLGWSGLVRGDSVRYRSFRCGADGWYRFQSLRLPQTLRVSYRFQKSDRHNGGYEVENFSLRWDVQAGRKVSGGTYLGVVNSGKLSYTSGFSLRHMAMNRRLSSSIGVNFRFGEGYTSVSSSLGSRFSITPSDVLSFSLRRTDYFGSSYHETTASLSFDHRFRVTLPAKKK